MIAVRRHLLARVDGADEGRALTLFEAWVVYTFGRPLRLQAY